MSSFDKQGMKTILAAVSLAALTACTGTNAAVQDALAYRMAHPHRMTGAGGNYQPNAYGLGVGMDQYGRPVRQPDPSLQVQPNAYGLGVGMDQYGRPVY